MGIVTIKGQKIDQEKLRAFLDSIDVMDYEQPDGTWMSPITKEIFQTRQALFGHFSAYLRVPRERKDVTEPTRAGYIRALRAGIRPTPEQRKAHNDYSNWYRTEGRYLNKLKRDAIDRGEDPSKVTLDD